YEGKWLKKVTQDRAGETVITEDDGVDTEKGIVINNAWTVGGKKMRSYQTLWSPFIIEALMKQRGWKLVFRAPEPEWKGWLDVYKKL
ncbi:hypothetical protein H0N95_01585, partial [Candidatus Micrarchaeota archaeon]|nr:hypothetical protein [Candidatus Micrarchaeota archaeon]